MLNEYIQATDTHKPVSIQYVPFIFSAVESLYVQNSKNILLQLNDHATIQSSKPFNIHGVRVLKFTEIFLGEKSTIVFLITQVDFCSLLLGMYLHNEIILRWFVSVYIFFSLFILN